jgi:hypothetical protein
MPAHRSFSIPRPHNEDAHADVIALYLIRNIGAAPITRRAWRPASMTMITMSASKLCCPAARAAAPRLRSGPASWSR